MSIPGFESPWDRQRGRSGANPGSGRKSAVSSTVERPRFLSEQAARAATSGCRRKSGANLANLLVPAITVYRIVVARVSWAHEAEVRFLLDRPFFHRCACCTRLGGAGPLIRRSQGLPLALPRVHTTRGVQQIDQPGREPVTLKRHRKRQRRIRPVISSAGRSSTWIECYLGVVVIPVQIRTS